MPKPWLSNVNPFRSASYAVPRNTHICAHPNCNLPVTEATMLCELHGSGHRPRQVEDDDE